MPIEDIFVLLAIVALVFYGRDMLRVLWAFVKLLDGCLPRRFDWGRPAARPSNKHPALDQSLEPVVTEIRCNGEAYRFVYLPNQRWEVMMQAERWAASTELAWGWEEVQMLRALVRPWEIPHPSFAKPHANKPTGQMDSNSP